MIMPPSPWLFTYLRSVEKFRPTAFKPTPRDVWTLGYGHTHGVRQGDTCTVPTANDWLVGDVDAFGRKLAPLVHVTLNLNQSDAIRSLTYNIGVGKQDGVKGDFADSTLLRKLNAGDFTGAAAEFVKWDHQGGMELAGLKIRRTVERDHFLS